MRGSAEEEVGCDQKVRNVTYARPLNCRPRLCTRQILSAPAGIGKKGPPKKIKTAELFAHQKFPQIDFADNGA